MERIFVSYTYNPHPDHAADTDLLQRTARRVIEAMDLGPTDGLDLGGRALDTEIEKRIADSDAMIALFMPQASPSGALANPQFVMTEYQHARTLGKPRLRVIHDLLDVRGLGANEEYQPYAAGKAFDVTLKLMNTIALWKRELGRAVQVRIDPEDLARRFKVGSDHCEYELMVNYKMKAPAETIIWNEPGGVFVHVPNLIDGAKLLVRMRIGNEPWESDFTLPHMAGISLARR